MHGMTSPPRLPNEFDVDARVGQIRNLVNALPRRAELQADKKAWNQLCSAMDAVADAEHALEGHTELARRLGGLGPGPLYLVHYGFVQALYLQQTAVSTLCRALGLDDLEKRVEELQHLKDLRNDVAHPTDRRGGKQSFGIVQISMTPGSFELFEFGGADFKLRLVDCAAIRCEQDAALQSILGAVVERLVTQENDHRMKFRAEKLTEHFKGISYLLGKIAEGASDFDNRERAANVTIGRTNVDLVRERVLKFRDALHRRGLSEVSRYEVERALKACDRLAAYYETAADPFAAEAMTELLCKSVASLTETAESLDRTYDEPVRS